MMFLMVKGSPRGDVPGYTAVYCTAMQAIFHKGHIDWTNFSSPPYYGSCAKPSRQRLSTVEGAADVRYTVSSSSRVNWMDNEAEVEHYSDRVANSVELHNGRNCRLSKFIQRWI